jgi:hypothetical protein
MRMRMRAQAQVSEDYRLDPALFAACQPAVKELCGSAGAEPGGGGELECLVRARRRCGGGGGGTALVWLRRQRWR